MKKILFLMTFLICVNYNYANKFCVNYTDLINDTFNITQIRFSRGGMWQSDSRQLVENDYYTLTINKNKTANLTWLNGYPKNKDNVLIPSYSGKITKRQFRQLRKKIIEVGFINLESEYKPLNRIDHITADYFEITFNNQIKKTILDENLDLVGLNDIRDMLIQLKKEITWTPDKN
jgi:hypothetical protein